MARVYAVRAGKLGAAAPGAVAKGDAVMAEPIPLPKTEPEGLEAAVPGTVSRTTTDNVITTVQSAAPSWLHLQVRNIILLGVTGAVIYLGILGVQEARSALFTTFISLASYLFAERAALARPGETK